MRAFGMIAGGTGLTPCYQVLATSPFATNHHVLLTRPTCRVVPFALPVAIVSGSLPSVFMYDCWVPIVFFCFRCILTRAIVFQTGNQSDSRKPQRQDQCVAYLRQCYF